MADKEPSTNKEVQRSKEFQDQLNLKEKVLNTIKEILVSSTNKVFKSLGVENNTSHAGEYGDGTKYGAGAKANTFNVKIAGKTKSHFTKEIIFGAKNMISVINVVFNGDVVKVEYKSPESGFFRGVDADGKTYMVNEKMNVSATDMTKFKSVIEKLFSEIAERELGFLISTKKGVEDKTEKSTTSVVESIKQDYNMKKLTIKELFSESEEDLDNQSSEEKTDKSKKDNTVDLKKTNPPVKADDDKKMFFDEEDEEKKSEKKEKLVQKEITSSGPAIAGSAGGFKDGAPSGAGGYNAKNAWKKTNYAKAKEAKETKPTITKDWNVVPKSGKSIESEATGEKSSASQNIKAEVPANKSNGVVDGGDKNSNPKNNNTDWSNKSQTKAPSSDKDNFWQEVKLEPDSGYVPVGMKQNFVAGMHDASKGDLKKRGYAEGEQKEGELLNENTQPAIQLNSKKPDLTKKKFFTEADNKAAGVNKRYLITEKTTEEYEQERWKKLTQFKTYESIKEAEEMNDFFESIQNDKDTLSTPIFTKKNLTESYSHDDIFNEGTEELVNESTDGVDTVTVEKPGSKFGLEYKFFKKDFLNENKKYILDLNSRVFVPNPNSK